jgi:hypothetical protein
MAGDERLRGSRIATGHAAGQIQIPQVQVGDRLEGRERRIGAFGQMAREVFRRNL